MMLQNISRYATNHYKRVWLVLVTISIFGMMDIPADVTLGSTLVWKWIDLVSISAFKSTVLAVLLIYGGRNRALSIVANAIVVLYSVICVFNGLVYGLYGMGISTKLMTIIGQTNRNEVLEFMATVPRSILWVLGKRAVYLIPALFAILVFYAVKLGSKAFTIVVSTLSASGFVILVSTMISLQDGRTAYLAILRLGRSVTLACKESVLMRQDLGKLTELPAAATVGSTRNADVVMVVGESASRERLSLYGYPLATSPKLDAIKDSLIVFDDVTGTSTTTADNMRRILTFLADKDDTEEWYGSPMLVELMNKAGYTTTWLSNQEKCGLWGNSTAIMVSMADDVKYLSGMDNTDVSLQNYDGVLLPELAAALHRCDGAAFVGLHLMGSHNQYRRRYPEDYDVFNRDSVLKVSIHGGLSGSQARTVAEYLNSLRYTDYVLSRIIEMVDERERPAVMIYFSDHGENVYDDNQGYLGRDRKHVQVPFVIYVNGKFAAQYPGLTERLREVRHRSMSTAEIPHLICALTGTRYQMYADTLDITSRGYVERVRYVDGERWEYESGK